MSPLTGSDFQITRSSPNACWRSRVSRLAVAAFLLVGGLASWLPAVANADDPPPRLREMCDFLAQHPAYRCEFITVLELKSDAVDHRQETKFQFKLQRPNRVALVGESGESAMTIISDGETLSISIPQLQRYVQGEAPDTLVDLLTGDSAMPLMMLGPAGGSIPLGGDAYYDHLIDGITSSKLVGDEDVDGVPCQRFDMTQDALDWSLWIRSGDQPLPIKMSVDLAKQAAAGLPAGASITSTASMKNWDLSPKWTDEDFHFDPPAGSQKADSLFEGMDGGGSNAPHALIGKPAPPLALDDRAGESVQIDKSTTDHVIVLDFWATWCPPCVEALPKVAEAAGKFADRGVRFYAVNVGEDSETVEEFLKEHSLDIPVLFDEDGEASAAYSASAIPQTVIVGKSGIVEVVHVGASGQLEKQLTEEIDQLLAGKSLADETLAKAEQAMQARIEQTQPFGASEVWKADGRFSSVAVDQTAGSIIANEEGGTLKTFDKDGKKTAEAAGQPAAAIRLANLRGDDQPEVLLFRPWGSAVVAQTLAGETLWTYEVGQGVDDVYAFDIQADGFDEVIIGYNGSTGLHVLDAAGIPLWKDTSLGNVWHVTAGDIDRDGHAEVISTSAEGRVHLFSSTGENTNNFTLAPYATMVRTLLPTDADHPPQIIVAGELPDGTEALVSIQSSGEENFSLTLPTLETNFVDDLAIDNGARLAAAAMRGGLVHVIDLDDGKLLATVAPQSNRCSVAWLARTEESPQLIVATEDGLFAYQLER